MNIKRPVTLVYIEVVQFLKSIKVIAVTVWVPEIPN